MFKWSNSIQVMYNSLGVILRFLCILLLHWAINLQLCESKTLLSCDVFFLNENFLANLAHMENYTNVPPKSLYKYQFWEKKIYQ